MGKVGQKRESQGWVKEGVGEGRVGKMGGRGWVKRRGSLGVLLNAFFIFPCLFFFRGGGNWGIGLGVVTDSVNDQIIWTKIGVIN